MSEATLRQWNLIFEDQRQLHLKRTGPEPFVTKKDLGRGGCGVVYKTRLGGVAVALKTMRTRKVTNASLLEIQVLRHVSKDRHQHIVALIGSYVYTESQKGFYGPGLVIWPVAQCDLQHPLSEMEILALSSGRTLSDNSNNDELRSAIQTASAVVSTKAISSTSELYRQAIRRLARSFGCIASAMCMAAKAGSCSPPRPQACTNPALYQRLVADRLRRIYNHP